MLTLTLTLLTAAPPLDPGYLQLVNGSPNRCGVPASIWLQALGAQKPSLPGRTGTNARLADDFVATKGLTGLEVVSPNCLQCHAGRLLGKTVLGLGNSFVDETVDPSAIAQFARGFLPPGNARTELERFLVPVSTVGPHIVTDTVGVSSADDLAVTLMAHRDAKTLAWRTRAEPPLDGEPPVPVDVPAWWLARDKKTVFATGIGRGDRATLMASASLLCTDSVKDAEKVIAAFAPVPKYVDTLAPPKWPWPLDAALVATGEALYAKRCAGCHDKAEVVPLEKVKTDPLLAQRTSTDASPRLAWFNASVYGRTAKLEPTNGYVAQPLTGVWATAPYFHNGSVPNLAAVLDSSQRPEKWSRTFDSLDYDRERVGWNFTLEQEKTSARVYDTTRRGYGNGGHTFGDALGADERRALLEYLKTR
jgi:mono/diheme cytochrome c family protein